MLEGGPRVGGAVVPEGEDVRLTHTPSLHAKPAASGLVVQTTPVTSTAVDGIDGVVERLCGCRGPDGAPRDALGLRSDHPLGVVKAARASVDLGLELLDLLVLGVAASLETGKLSLSLVELLRLVVVGVRCGLDAGSEDCGAPDDLLVGELVKCDEGILDGVDLGGGCHGRERERESGFLK